MSRPAARLLAFVLAFLWGLTFVLVKIGEEGFGLLGLASLRFGIAAGVFLLFYSVRVVPLALIRKQDLPRFGVLVLSLVGGQYVLISAVQSLSASVVSIVAQTTPVFTLFLSVLGRKERFRWGVFAGMTVALAGTVLVILGSGPEGGRGIAAVPLLIALLVPLSVALYNLLGKPLTEKYGPANLAGQLVIATGAILVATIPLHSSPTRLVEAGPPSWLAILGLAIPCTVVTYVLWAVLLKHISRSEVASIMYLAPVFSVGLAVSMLGEGIEASFVVGAGLTLIGLILIDRHAAGVQESPASPDRNAPE